MVGAPANLALITDPQEFDLENWRIGNTDDDLVMISLILKSSAGKTVSLPAKSCNRDLNQNDVIILQLLVNISRKAW